MKIILAIFILSCFIIIVVISTCKNRTKKERLIVMGKISSGVISNCRMLPKHGGALDIEYKFSTEKLLVSKSDIIDGISEGAFNKYFLEKTFPVIYDSIDLGNSEILITPDRFEKYKIKFPDSLEWVKKYWTYDYRRLD